jgi:hypothetical protein
MSIRFPGTLLHVVRLVILRPVGIGRDVDGCGCDLISSINPAFDWRI